jgi:threonine aldolase
MRQAGVLAAACLYALDHNVSRLAEDHANAKVLAEALEQTDGFRVRAADIETNLVWFDVDPSLGTAKNVAQRFASREVLTGALGAQLMRVYTHLNVNRDDVEHVARLIPEVAAAPV